jgi:hypothetical protein
VYGRNLSAGSSKPKEVRFWEGHQKLGVEFISEDAWLKPNARVVPTILNTPLFQITQTSTDLFGCRPVQRRAEGRSNSRQDDLCKKFRFRGWAGERRAADETRLLVHARSGWVPLPYVWNVQQTEATLQIAADPINVQFTDAAGRKRDFAYHIPNTNECLQCHENAKVMFPIGPKARNLNKTFHYADGEMNQIP